MAETANSTSASASASIAIVFLYALVAADSDFAVDVFVSQESAENALREVLCDEPGFVALLSIVALPPPWLDDADRTLEPDPR